MALLGRREMSAFLPLLGDKRTSNAPSPGVTFMSTRRSERAQPFEAQQGDCWRLSVSPRRPREPAPDRSAPLILIKENVCRLLEARLREDGFNVLNAGRVIYFPCHGRQNDFHRQFAAVLKSLR